jgi:hypothetical protein
MQAKPNLGFKHATTQRQLYEWFRSYECGKQREKTKEMGQDPLTFAVMEIFPV